MPSTYDNLDDLTASSSKPPRSPWGPDFGATDESDFIAAGRRSRTHGHDVIAKDWMAHSDHLYNDFEYTTIAGNPYGSSLPYRHGLQQHSPPRQHTHNDASSSSLLFDPQSTTNAIEGKDNGDNDGDNAGILSRPAVVSHNHRDGAGDNTRDVGGGSSVVVTTTSTPTTTTQQHRQPLPSMTMSSSFYPYAPTPTYSSTAPYPLYCWTQPPPPPPMPMPPQMMMMMPSTSGATVAATTGPHHHPPETSATALEFVVDVQPSDVLSGRGGATNSHSGNRYFRSLVKEHQERYLQAKKKDKPDVAAAIVDLIRKRGGRFLRRWNEDNNDRQQQHPHHPRGPVYWVDIGDDRAREKTCQALREGAPEIRRKKMARGSQKRQQISSPPPSCSVAVDEEEEEEDENEHEKHSSSPSTPVYGYGHKHDVPKRVTAPMLSSSDSPSGSDLTPCNNHDSRSLTTEIPRWKGKKVVDRKSTAEMRSATTAAGENDHENCSNKDDNTMHTTATIRLRWLNEDDEEDDSDFFDEDSQQREEKQKQKRSSSSSDGSIVIRPLGRLMPMRPPPGDTRVDALSEEDRILYMSEFMPPCPPIRKRKRRRSGSRSGGRRDDSNKANEGGRLVVAMCR